jgi:hypothetical protein
MPDLKRWSVILQLAAAAACSPAGPGQAPAPAPVGPAAQPAGGQPGPGARRRQPPNPVVQDSLRRLQVDSILRTIAGRESEPAGKVFRNVRVLKDMPAGEFVRQMDTNYGRGLGWTCNNCHVVGEFNSDTRKNKRIARQMQEMTLRLNQREFPRIKELDAEYEKVTCVMCHRGSNEPRGTMPVPAAPVPGPGPD